MLKNIKGLILKKLRRALLPKDVFDLVEDIGAKNSHKVIDNIDNYIPDNGEEFKQYFGDIITIHKNRQSSPGHPKSFLCYITIQEAKYLRSLGLGYSLHVESGEFRQHCGKFCVPSFQGGDGGGGGGDGGSGAGGNGGLGAGGSQGATGNAGVSAGFGSSHDGGYAGHGTTAGSAGGNTTSSTSDDSSVGFADAVSGFFGGLFGGLFGGSKGDTGGAGDGGLGALGLGGYGTNEGQINGATFGGFNSSGDTVGFGLLGSFVAAITRSYSLGLAADTVSSLASAMMGMLNAVTALTTGVGVVGFALGLLGLLNAKSAVDHIGIMGGTADEGFANTSEHVNDHVGNGLKSEIEKYNTTKSEKALQKQFINNVLTGEIFDWLAGGVSYNAVFAGGTLFNSMGIINPLGKSLGFKADVDTSFINDINFPYSTNAGGGGFTNYYFGVPLAGDDYFSPLKWANA